MKKFFYKLYDFYSSIRILKFEYFNIWIRSFRQRHKDIFIKKKIIQILTTILIISLFILIVIQGYRLPWTGFSGIDGDLLRRKPKLLWDWMELLIIPCFLGFLAYSFTNAQKTREISIAQINKRDKALQQYFDYITNLITNGNAFSQEMIEVTKRVARATTLSVLDILDGKQKGHILRFLIEAELINKNDPFIELRRANFENLELDPGSYIDCNLKGVNIDKANLGWCSFSNSDMSGITMQNAYLESANFTDVNLDYALLSNSDFYRAILRNTHLIKADLQKANLQLADLTNAKLRSVNLINSNLCRSNLTNAYLRFSDLAFTNLKYADLTNADLVEVNFFGAKLNNSILTNSNLEKSNISRRQLHVAKSIDKAILPFLEKKKG